MRHHLPVRLKESADHGLQVEWVWTDGRRLTEPFYEDTVRRLRWLPENRGLKVASPLESLALHRFEREPAGVIFHMSRCGSTLLAQLLASLERNVVIAEAPILDDIIRAPVLFPGLRVEQPDLLRSCVGGIMAGVSGAEQASIYLKLDCWHVFELPLIRRVFPRAPFYFVFRDPLEVAVSLIRMPSMALIRGTISPAQLQLTVAQRDALGREDYIAALLGALLHAASVNIGELTLIRYEQLPDCVWQMGMGGDLGAAERRLLQQAGRVDAKRPRERFRADSVTKRAQASPMLATAINKWSAPAHQALIEKSQSVRQGVNLDDHSDLNVNSK